MTLFTPKNIAEMITPAGDAVYAPTAEQEAIITAPLDTPLLVVAGAGSGKTETMAQRVVWLIANGVVAPSEVLGLTFTRKAAGELADRIRSHLHRLRVTLPARLETLGGENAARAQSILDALGDEFARPTVSTYNAFAGTVLAEYGELAGLTAESVIIDDATAWRLAREVVNDSADPRLLELDLEPGPLVEHVLKLARGIRENLVSGEDVAAFAHEFLELRELPYDDRTGEAKPQPTVTEATAAIEKLPLLVDLAREFQELKRRRGLVEFADQVALALETVRASQTVALSIRGQYRVVLLDEYQDTSVAQTSLLTALFTGHGVMAVGDPHQSIYGWRGASSSNLAEFRNAFGVTHETLSLSTSWRNATTVLNVANTLVQPLVQQSKVAVRRLDAKPGAPAGEITAVFARELHDEASTVAAWLAEHRDAFFAEHGRYPTCAVIMRRRALMGYFSTVLTQARVPNEIVGVGGLLTSPEITDLICTLRCLWRVDAGSELIRLLVGPRWRIGVADLRALRELSFWLGQRDFAFQSLTDAERDAQRTHEMPSTDVTILEALDVLTTLPDDHAALRGFTELGLSRLREAGRVLAGLRARTANLRELVRQIESELRLDIELAANETIFQGDGHRARANLDAFYDLVDTFTSVDDEGTLPSLLAWLDRAVREDAVAEQTVEPSPTAVQIITVHGAKGLEWDYVVVPRMVNDEFPSKPQSLRGWFTAGELPYELRGDAANLPVLPWRGLATKLDFKKRYEGFVAELRDHLAAEERRLIYVAVTRAKRELLLTGSFWAGQTQPREPSVYLRELADAALIPAQPDLSAAGEKPDDAGASRLAWPMDPLGERRSQVSAAASAVRQALVETSDDGEADLEATPEIRLLLAERDRQLAPQEIPLPERVNASGFKDFVTQPEQIRRRLRRPIPERPYRQAKVGTLFHQWVERRYGTPFGSAETLDIDEALWADENIVDEFGAALPEQGTGADQIAQQLAALQQSFEASPWGDRQPAEIEREITVSFAGRRLVCKIDAVYANTNGSYEIVDWKTGAAPQTDEEKRERMLQLELYRHAFAAWKGIDLELVSCALFYVATGQIVRAEGSLSFAELEQKWLAAAAIVQDESDAREQNQAQNQTQNQTQNQSQPRGQ